MNPLNKLIGLVASAVVVIGVVGTTIYQENNSSTSFVATSNTPTISTTTFTQINTPTTVTTSTPTPAKTTPTKKITYVKKCTTSGGGEDDDGGGTTTCVNVPVTTTVNTPVSTPVSTPVVTTPPPATVPKTASVYKNGTYSATGSYMSPGGQDQVSVTLTLANDIITSVSVSFTGDRTSQRYQSRFASGYQQYVVGQNIANVNLTNVSGSSLTPIGFNDALSQIMSQAKA